MRTSPAVGAFPSPHPFIFLLSFILPPSILTGSPLRTPPPRADAVIHHADTSG